MYVFNCLDKYNTIKVGGQHFHFKPNQIKFFYQAELGRLIARERQEYGFAELPDAFEDADYQKSEEGKAILVSKKREGVEAYCKRLREVVYNLQVSLKRDLDMANIKTDPRVYASKGELEAFEELVKYQSSKDDADQKRVDRIKELEKKLETK